MNAETREALATAFAGDGWPEMSDTARDFYRDEVDAIAPVFDAAMAEAWEHGREAGRTVNYGGGNPYRERAS